jgi:hypothetical protein
VGDGDRNCCAAVPVVARGVLARPGTAVDGAPVLRASLGPPHVRVALFGAVAEDAGVVFAEATVADWLVGASWVEPGASRRCIWALILAIQ